MIESIQWATVNFSSQAIASWIWEPIFTWWWNLISIFLKFIPVMIIISFFWIIFKWIKKFMKKKKSDDKKDLYNK